MKSRGLTMLLGAALVTTVAAGMPVSAMAQGGQGGSQGQGRENHFQRMDMNQDSKISVDEAQDAASKRFDQIDTDTDGEVTMKDVEGKIEQMRNQNAQVPEKHLNRRAQMLRAQFKQLDTDGDGVLTEQEYTAKATMRHEQLDQNDDGTVTKGEIREMRRKIREQVQQQREQMQQQRQGQQ